MRKGGRRDDEKAELDRADKMYMWWQDSRAAHSNVPKKAL